MHGLVRLLNSLEILPSNTPTANTLIHLFANLCITTGMICLTAKASENQPHEINKAKNKNVRNCKSQEN